MSEAELLVETGQSVEMEESSWRTESRVDDGARLTDDVRPVAVRCRQVQLVDVVSTSLLARQHRLLLTVRDTCTAHSRGSRTYKFFHDYRPPTPTSSLHGDLKVA